MVFIFNWIFLIFSGLLLIASCGLPEVPPAGESDSVFITSVPSRLYFKNIRSASYEKATGPAKGTDIYTLRALNVDSKEPVLILQIVDHWLDDKAYLHIRKNSESLFADTLTLQWSMADSVGYLSLPNAGHAAQYNFTAELYQLLVNRADIAVKNRDDKFVPVLHTANNRSAFITTLRDYYRLTDVSKGSLY